MRRLTFGVALMLLIAACGDNAADQTGGNTVAPEPGDTATVAAGVELAESAIAAWNTNDIDAFFSHFGSEATFDGLPIQAEDVRKDLGFWMALGDRVVVEQCDPDDFGWIICRSTSSDQLSGPAGAIFRFAFLFTIEEGVIVGARINPVPPPPPKEKIQFTLAMVRWVEETHPEVWASTFAAPDGCVSSHAPGGEFNCYESAWYSSSEAAATLLELIDEFMLVVGDYWSDA